MLIKNPLLLIVVISISTLTIGCNGGKMEEKTIQFPSIKDVSASSWENLAQKKIFFGHQSVGNNILEGIRDVMKENPRIKLNVVETIDPAALNAPIFAHSKVGKNTDPKSKIDAFADILDRGIGSKVNIAFLKFCYADATENTDIDKVFDNYQKAILELKKKYPQTTFVHITIPITTVQSGIKAFIKKTIGRSIDGYDKNIKRELLNERLRRYYGTKDPIFDIAKIESTFPESTRSSFNKDGNTYYSMVPEYTYDGCHLNKKGRKLVAEQLLIFLANVAG
jgi:lysophospholipase L1-like esterase